MMTKGFTLVEVLVAVMLTGILTALALVPVVRTVNSVVSTQQEYTDYAALSRTLDFIARDLNSAMRLASPVLAVKDHEALGGNADDVLIVMSTSPSAQNMPPGSVVYKLAEGGIMHTDTLSGLYRWIVPGVSPEAVKTDTLSPEDGQLVLPGVTAFSVEIPYGDKEDERRKSYSGVLPAGLVMSLERKEDKNDEPYTLERTFVFP